MDCGLWLASQLKFGDGAHAAGQPALRKLGLFLSHFVKHETPRSRLATFYRRASNPLCSFPVGHRASCYEPFRPPGPPSRVRSNRNVV